MARPEKDKRLYMTFPNDFHRHPKMIRLDPAARWAFVEMNGEARIADNDGIFSAEDAEFLWSAEVLEALLSSHPSRPLLVRDAAGNYVIREYEKHQQTRGERDELARIARENGAKGGRPRKPRGNPAETQGVLNETQPQANGTQPKAQSESESELPDLVLTESVSLGSNARANSTGLTQEEITRAKHTASGLNLDLDRIIRGAVAIDRDLDHRQALRLGVIILDKAKAEPDKPTAYVCSVLKQSWAEAQKWIDTEVLT